MQPPQTPIPPWGSKSRRELQPPLLSPSYSRKPFQAAAAAASSEHPCVTLFEWWLERVEGDDQKIAVAGKFERNETVQQFDAAAIAKRHKACVLETEDGIILRIYGSLSLSQMHANGYSSEVCEKFIIGFPYWWENCNQLYPKTAQTRSDKKQFYSGQFQRGQEFHSCGTSFLSELRSSVKKSSHNDAAFQNSPQKQRSALEKLQGATRSPFARPVPYAHESPLTRGRATSLSMSTPEALKLRKTRSGRLVVPTLDIGCQRIVHDWDGTIAGVIGLDSPSPKGSKLKAYARRKREAKPSKRKKRRAH
ncbi:uncharacterized protein LOC120693907 [Panicum virgatum]|uniref:uncharacterized protein LOC120693907 n=1 Tax=Panicum virgatum TaxID=38727 RepID=UPI0019D53FC3|nr:uncharacterized protein LOC120693907 [Panicum virgatum]KAG2481666.1 hypothetical protein PVAP13_J676401 [Panicum virgatum]